MCEGKATATATIKTTTTMYNRKNNNNIRVERANRTRNKFVRFENMA